MFTSSNKRPYHCLHRHGHIPYNACTHTQTDTKTFTVTFNQVSQIAAMRESEKDSDRRYTESAKMQMP